MSSQCTTKSCNKTKKCLSSELEGCQVSITDPLAFKKLLQRVLPWNTIKPTWRWKTQFEKANSTYEDTFSEDTVSKSQ